MPWHDTKRSSPQETQEFTISEEIIGRLYRCPEHGLDEILRTFSEQQRVRLATFCYARSHLRSIGIAIAATCEVDALIDAAGYAGRALHAHSRERPVAAIVPTAPVRRPVTLAASAGMKLRPFDQDAIEPDALSA